MLSNILQTVVLAGFLSGIIYGVTIIASGKNRHLIFKVTLISIVALFISRLFFIVLVFAGGNENSFSVGVLGQVAGYLFLVLASKTYFPFEVGKHGFSIKAALIILIPLACYSYCIFVSKSLSEIICTVLYLCSTCLALYYSFKNVLLSKTDGGCRRLKNFSIAIMALTLVSTLENIVVYIENQVIFATIGILMAAIIFADAVLILPLLNREVRKHDC